MNIPEQESLITDSQFFNALDFCYPGLEMVQKYYNQGNLTAAKKATIQYFEKRANVCYLFDYRGLPLIPIDTDECPYSFQSSLGLSGSLKEQCLFTAKKIMEHTYVVPGAARTEVFLGSHWENMIHYRFPEDSGVRHRQPFNMIVRGQFLESLCVLYHETGDESVLPFFEEILSVYWNSYPLIIEDGKPDSNRFQYTDDRDVMSVGWLAMVYLSLFYTRVPYELSTETAFDILKHLWFLGIQFTRFDEDCYRPYNHHMWERGLVPFLLGTLLPEIPAFRERKALGASIVSRHISEDFNQWGGYNEHSIAYWAGAALGEMVYRGVYIARLNKEPLLSDESAKRLLKTFELLGHLCPPGSRFPSLGDNGGPMATPMICLAVRMFDLPWAKELAAIRKKSKKEEIPPLPLDYANDKTGFICSRNHYSEDGNLLVMSAKTDCGWSGHNHMDMLSLFVTFRGKEIFGEPYAGDLYHSVRMNSYERGYMYNMVSHNTVLAYGEPICPNDAYANKWGVYRPDSPIVETHSTEKGFYAEAYHDGYTHCRHKRKLLFNRNKGFLLCDLLERGNRQEAPHIQRWHLMKGTVCRLTSPDTVVIEASGVTLLASWISSHAITIYKNRSLCPHPYPSEESLSNIIDVSFKARPERNSDNMTASLFLVMADVTGRELTKTALEEYGEKSRRIAEAFQKQPEKRESLLDFIAEL